MRGHQLHPDFQQTASQAFCRGTAPKLPKEEIQNGKLQPHIMSFLSGLLMKAEKNRVKEQLIFALRADWDENVLMPLSFL